MFVHLHNHSEYSLIDGSSGIEEMVIRSKELGMNALALTDHGNMFGAIEFYKSCIKHQIKPIIGCELYVAPKNRLEKDPNIPYYHLTVLSKNFLGYKNLIEMVTLGNLEGFYHRPRVDKDLLAKHKEGLIILSGCPSSELSKLIINKNQKGIEQYLYWATKIFEDNFYLELMWHDKVPNQDLINENLIKLSKEFKIPLVATNDNHYISSRDAESENLLKNIKNNFRKDLLEDHTYYIKSPEEMSNLWKNHPEAISNTQKIADSCDLKLDFNVTRIPSFQTPESKTAEEYLNELCFKGFEKKFPNQPNEIKERLEYELNVINTLDFPDYFLVVWDIFKFVKRKKILTSLRGSASASMVLYCLEITNIDPIKAGLVFERFLNIERKEMPDIDIDFQDDKRKEVIDYCIKKYGRDHIAQIISFSRLYARGATRGAGRVMGKPLSDVEKVAELIPARDPYEPTKPMSLERALELVPDLKTMYDEDINVSELINAAKTVEKRVSNIQTHAAGVIISKEPLKGLVPLLQAPKDPELPPLTQYEMGPLADLGLLKIDFLGLTNLTILDKTIKMINKRHNLQLNLETIPLDNNNTFELLSSGDTLGVFQLESDGMKRNIKELKPSSISDISAMIALYRPGPMEHISTFIEAKHGRIPIKYPHPSLENLLKETYGIIVYQDQVLLISQAIAGYSLGDADKFRKAMGKKIPEVMRAEKDKFINGTIKNDFPEKLGSKVFELIEPFAGYAFNKAHSMSYAMIAYWTAYFKANYPHEFMTILLDSVSGNKKKIGVIVRECEKIGIYVKGPNINHSKTAFYPESESDGTRIIRFGLGSIKNVGSISVDPIVKNLEKNGPYKNLEDFIQRIDFSINKSTLESLIKTGTFDEFSTRETLLSNLERIISLINQQKTLNLAGQSHMFDLFGESVAKPIPLININSEENINDQERSFWERELLGITISHNDFQKKIMAQTGNFIVYADQISNAKHGNSVNLIGQVINIESRKTRRGDTFFIIDLGLLDSDIEIIVWPNNLDSSRFLWEKGKFISINGTTRINNGIISVVFKSGEEFLVNTENYNGMNKNKIDSNLMNGNNSNNNSDFIENIPIPQSPNGGKIKPELPNSHNSSNKLMLSIEESGNPIEDRYKFEDLIKLLLEHKGSSPVILKVFSGNEEVTLELPFANININSELEEKVIQIVGDNNYSVINESS